VKLLDFGVSKLLNDAGGARITGSGAPIGTPLYMSPEQAEGKDDTDGRADIWSLGAVLYEALAGAPPFADRGSYHGTIVGILTSRPKLLHDAAPWVPIELAKVVDAMLVHDRNARIKTAELVTKRLLEAYPTVLPDGPGRHTAVIVPTVHAVDATGDTEIFTSQGFQTAQRSSRPSGEQIPDDEDSKRTVPNVSSSPGSDPRGVSSDATRTAAATPVEMGRESTSSSPPVVSGVSARGAGGPRTDPMPSWRSGASSSASGVAMPGTPPIIEPLALSERAPDTQRDEALAVRAERRRWVSLVMVASFIAAVALGSYFAGKRSSPPDTAVPTATAPTVTGAATSTATSTSSAGTAAPTSSAISPSPSPSPVTPPSASPSSSAPASAPASASGAALTPEPTAKVHRRPRRPAAAAPAESAAEPKPELPPAPVRENPFDTQ
jgi:serine/threonine-protein kinase